jgi:hypothetical protein
VFEFDGDVADCVIAVAANADTTFKPCTMHRQVTVRGSRIDVQIILDLLRPGP